MVGVLTVQDDNSLRKPLNLLFNLESNWYENSKGRRFTIIHQEISKRSVERKIELVNFGGVYSHKPSTALLLLL
ncbi:hypothetical protein J5N97_019164 [Dioscorea zingiberensis]|uniref:Uncharacterized protein n=1 Tax=Dioscorea zingiberensis TaxID=325984 RepID=A0A9D5HCF0_9LILI|nr:hypothetical protein J5N97_019164 [Dioscorea zingiberensis]